MLRWRDAVVGRLLPGETLSAPLVEPLADEVVERDARAKVRRRLQAFVRSEVARRLAPLFAAHDLPLGGAGRGLVFQLADGLGALPAAAVAGQLGALDRQDRTALTRQGVRFGTETVYFAPLLRAEAQHFRALLWAVRHGRPVPPLPPAHHLGRPFAVDPGLPSSFYAALGFAVLDGLALRADRLERFAAAARHAARHAPFAADRVFAAAAGIAQPALPRLLAALGYRAVRDAESVRFLPPAKRRRPGRRPAMPSEGHPFAKLRELKFA
jgi:ATP-dependent RNA helicase SUPV3L1/SUV3